MEKQIVKSEMINLNNIYFGFGITDPKYVYEEGYFEDADFVLEKSDCPLKVGNEIIEIYRYIFNGNILYIRSDGTIVRSDAISEANSTMRMEKIMPFREVCRRMIELHARFGSVLERLDYGVSICKRYEKKFQNCDRLGANLLVNKEIFNCIGELFLDFYEICIANFDPNETEISIPDFGNDGNRRIKKYTVEPDVSVDKVVPFQIR